MGPLPLEMLTRDEPAWPLADKLLRVGAEAGQDVTVAGVATVPKLAWPHDHDPRERSHDRADYNRHVDEAGQFGDPLGGVVAAPLPGAGDDDPLHGDPPRQVKAGHVPSFGGFLGDLEVAAHHHVDHLEQPRRSGDLRLADVVFLPAGGEPTPVEGGGVEAAAIDAGGDPDPALAGVDPDGRVDTAGHGTSRPRSSRACRHGHVSSWVREPMIVTPQSRQSPVSSSGASTSASRTSSGRTRSSTTRAPIGCW